MPTTVSRPLPLYTTGSFNVWVYRGRLYNDEIQDVDESDGEFIGHNVIYQSRGGFTDRQHVNRVEVENAEHVESLGYDSPTEWGWGDIVFPAPLPQ